MSEKPVFLFFNSASKEIFEYICNNPGSYLMDIVNNMNIPKQNAYRYLNKLLQTGIVKRKEFKGKVIYYPDGLRDEDVEKAFSQLKHESRMRIFLFVLNNPWCRQEKIVRYIDDLSKRQVIRLLEPMVDAELLDVTKGDDRSVTYMLGRIGREIVMDSFDKVDPFLKMIKEKMGKEAIITVENNLLSIEMMNGDIISIKLGNWRIMDLDDDSIMDNIHMLIADGGERVLTSIYSGCKDVESIATVSALPEKVVKAKLEALRRLGFIADFEMKKENIEITREGTSIVERIFRIKKK